MAKQLGLGRPGDTLGLGPVFGPLAYREMAEPPPLIARPAPGPAPPAPGAGNSREKTWARLRAEGWKSLGAVQSGLNGGGAVLQLLANGDGAYIYDEYAVEIEQMPSGKTPEAFLTDMATDLNGTVADQEFNGVNVFIRRPPGASSPPKIGDIIDIDIEGPDNGSVILVESEPTYFVFQTVESDKMGSHPENGSREFGFEREPSGKVRFYTRGVSRPGNWLVRKFGAGPQRKGWTRLMKGISAKIVSLGGKSNPGTFSEHKHESPE
jgi:hypothetical protein